jgi:hypothetical protein
MASQLLQHIACGMFGEDESVCSWRKGKCKHMCMRKGNAATAAAPRALSSSHSTCRRKRAAGCFVRLVRLGMPLHPGLRGPRVAQHFCTLATTHAFNCEPAMHRFTHGTCCDNTHHMI